MEQMNYDAIPGPAPQGAGGLKSKNAIAFAADATSRPARGGWIEIKTLLTS